jgi:16S rRNA G966 N2-methylase RsmD
MIESFLGVKNSLRNLSDEEFENVLPILANELENINFYAQYSDSELYKDWMNLKNWNSNVDEISSTQRIGMKLCEHFFPNFYNIENKKGESFKSLWKSDNLEKVLKWNRKSHTTPYLSELKRGIYFNFNLAKSTMFRPQLAKMIVSNLKSKRVLDPCAGWGGRLLGCVSADVEYVAFEPNGETYNGLIELVKFLGIEDKVTLIKDSALNMQKYNLGKFDLVLTSPPYFDLEVYSHEDTQSINGFDNYRNWLDGFLNPLIQLSNLHLVDEGWSCWNVHNVGKMKMIDDVKDIHKMYTTQKLFSVISSKRQTNQNTSEKKNSDITICYSKNKLQQIEFKGIDKWIT